MAAGAISKVDVAGFKSLDVAGVIASYWFVSISLVYINKFIVSGNSVPIFITWAQCLVTCGICWVFGMLGERARERGGKSRKEHGDDSKVSSSFWAAFPKAQYVPSIAKNVMPLSVIFVVMIVSNQFTLKYVEVSFYNVARSLTIVFNAIFSVAILGANVSARTAACLAVVITGFIVGVGGEVQLSPLGVQWGLISSVAVSLNSIYTKKVLPHVQNDAWRLTFINNANACFLFLPFVLWFEGADLIERYSAIFTSTFMAGLVVSGTLGFLMGIVSVMQIRVTSPLTHNISGTAKAAVQSAAAFFIWGNEATPSACLGIFFVVFGSGLYTWVKIKEIVSATSQKAAILPK